jgi:hypothetical protein
MKPKVRCVGFRQGMSWEYCIALVVCSALLQACGTPGTKNQKYEADKNRPLEAYNAFFLDPTTTQDPRGENYLVETLTGLGFRQIGYFESRNLDSTSASSTMEVWWGIVRIQTRGLGSYSQEARVIIKDTVSNDPIYIGTGEYMGWTQAGDIQGALKAALTGVNDYKGFNPELAEQILKSRDSGERVAPR